MLSQTNKRKNLLIVLIAFLLLLTLGVVSLISDVPAVQAETITKSIASPYYDGTEYTFSGSIDMSFKSLSKGLVVDYRNNTYYTNALTLDIALKGNTWSSHNGQKIKSVQHLANVTFNGTYYETPYETLAPFISDGAKYTYFARTLAPGTNTVSWVWNLQKTFGYNRSGSGSTKIVVDRAVPTGTLSGVSNGGTTSDNVSFSFSSSSSKAPASATLDGKPYTSGSIISAPGNHTIVLSNILGAKSTYTFTIDKTAPTITASCGSLTNSAFSVTATDDLGVSKILYRNGTAGGWTTTTSLSFTIPGDGDWYIKAIDFAGNESATINVTKDSILADYTLSGIEKGGGRTKSNVQLVWSESGATATLNGQPYSSGTWISAEGNHKFVLRDRYSNYTEISFEIDKTAPSFTLNGVENGGRTKNNVQLSWSESGATATLNGNLYPSGILITSNGRYTVILQDALGNKTTITFEIDKTAPTYTLSGVLSGSRTKDNVQLSWSESGATATLDGRLYSSGTWITTEGNHSIVLQDTLGNKVEITFEIDKTAPSFTLNGVENGGRTKNNVQLSWSESGATATLDARPYSPGAWISAEGSHSIVLQDALGNKVALSFEIDKTAPSFTLNGVKNGGRTKNSVQLSWSESGATATLNGQPYFSNAYINDEGKHTVLLQDALGNKTTISFEIDKTAPDYIISLSPYSSNNNIFYFNSDISLSWSESGATATLNNQSYIKNSIIHTEPDTEESFSFRITDDLGNSLSVTLVLDKKKYMENFSAIHNQYKSSLPFWHETYTYKFSNYKYVINNYYSFSSQEQISTFAINRELSTVEEHAAYLGGSSIFCDYAQKYVDSFDIANLTNMIGFPYKIYKSMDDPNKLTAYFNDGNFNKAINKYALSSISLKYLPSKPAVPYPGDNNIPPQTTFREEIFINSTSFRFPNGNPEITLILNGKVTTHLAASFDNGVNLVQEIDRAGNITEYIIILDTAPAKMTAYDFAGGYLSEISDWLQTRDSAYISTPFRMNVFDNYDNSSVFSVTYNNSTQYIFDNKYDFNQSGTYTITTHDVAGNSQTITLYVSLLPMNITANEIIQSYKTIAFTFDIHKIIDFNKTNGLDIFFRTDANSSWTTLSSDDKSTPISINTFNYYFFTNGFYKVALIDNFGRSTICEFEFKKDAPSGHLFTDNNLALANNALTNRKVYFSWDEESCQAFLNDAAYIKNTFITAEGKYTIRLEDRAGNFSVYTFEIDKTAPTYSLFYIDNNKQYPFYSNGSTRHNVFVQWDQNDNVTAKIKEAKDQNFNVLTSSSISAEGHYFIEFTDAAGNITTIEFTIRKTAPSVTIKDNKNNIYKTSALIKNSFFFTWEDSTATATLNGTPYTKSTLITTAGTYVFIITDSVGNEGFYTITLDNIPPIYTLVGVENGGRTKDNVQLSWSESSATATLNGEPYLSSQTIAAEGKHRVLLQDSLGNTVEITFEIDKTPPKYTVVGLENGNFTNQSVKLSWTENSVIAYLNNATFSSNTWISADGKYIFVLEDILGNKVDLIFEIDKSATEYTVVGLENNIYTNKNVSFSWEEQDVVATLNNKPYTSGQFITAENKYTFILLDKFGNKVELAFEIRYSIINYILDGVSENGITSNPVKLSWSESGATITLNNEPYTAGRWITAEGVYTFVIVDKFGNTKEFSFTLDKNVPSINMDNVSNDGKTKLPVTITWTDNSYVVTSNGNFLENGAVLDVPYNTESVFEIIVTSLSGVQNKYVFTIDKIAPTGELLGVQNNSITNSPVQFNWTENNAIATLNGIPYTSGQSIIADTDYIIILTDSVGNNTEYKFSIFTQPPRFFVEGITSTNITNSNVFITWYENYTATLNGEPYISGTAIADSNIYEFIITDILGNTTTYSFEIDKIPPIFEVFGVNETNQTSQNVTIIWTENSAIATLNGEPYISGTVIADSNIYEFIITDLVGNNTTYSFEINNFDIYIDIYGLNANNKSNSEVILQWQFDYVSALLNGEPYIPGTIISDEGHYSFSLINTFGKNYVLSFNIDKTPPVYVLSGVENGGFTNNNVKIDFDMSNIIAYYIDGVQYLSNTEISENGFYQIQLYDDVNNISYISFTINKIPPVYNLNALLINGRTNQDVSLECQDSTVISILLNKEPYIPGTIISEEGHYSFSLINNVGIITTIDFEIFKSPPTYTLAGVENGCRTKDNVKLSWKNYNYTAHYYMGLYDDTEENIFIYLLEQTLSAEGTYTIILQDELGNQVEITFEIDKTAPQYVLNGVENGGKSNHPITLDCLENSATALLDGLEYEFGTEIVAEGKHSLVLQDELGNQVEITFEIDTTAPSYIVEGIENNGITNKNVKISWTESGATATLNGESYTSNTWLVKEGKYTLILQDALGNKATITFEIRKTVDPIFIIDTADEEPLEIKPNKTYVAYNSITLNFPDNSTLFVNDEITDNPVLEGYGTYKIKITDMYNNSVEFNIEILDPTQTEAADKKTSGVIIGLSTGAGALTLTIIIVSLVLYKKRTKISLLPKN